MNLIALSLSNARCILEVASVSVRSLASFL